MKLLQENSGLSIDDPIWGPDSILGNDYLTDGKEYDSRLYDVTLRHLLEHTAGLDIKPDPMFAELEKSQGELITWVVDNREFVSNPGATMAYSNFGYCVLGRVIEKLSNKSYEEYVKDNILTQAGVSDMHIAGNLMSDRRPNEVYYYDNDGFDPYKWETARMDAHGGWIASSVDLVRLLSRVDGFPNKNDILEDAQITLLSQRSRALTSSNNQ